MCPEKGYVDQSPDALNLSIVKGGLELRQFNCLSEAKINRGNVTVIATVIGASHVLSVHTDGRESFHEILACVQPNSAADIVASMPLASASSGHTDVFDDIDYVFACRFLPWDQSSIETVRQFETARHTGEWTGASFAFPKSEDSPHVPVTTILMKEWSEALIKIATVHSYPGQGVVISNTTLRRMHEAA